MVIGIGEQEYSSWDKINGDKDVSYVLEILNDADYEQIITLVNEEATKDGIISAFETLSKSCQFNDVIYVNYSGHGQRMGNIAR